MARDVSPIHPQLRAVARVLPSRGPKDLDEVGWGRRLFSLAGRAPARGVEVVRVGAATVRVHRPRSEPVTPQPAILWIHGGGYVMGSAAAEDAFARQWVRRLGVTVVLPDYRLAPEHPFPAALEDCHAALEWLADRDEVDASRIGIGGASAGGGLAAALALLARERGVVSPAFQSLVFPMLDDRTAARADVDQTGVRVWDDGANRLGWRAYLGAEPGGDGVDPLAAPGRHPDLSGLPPAWLGVGTCDLFHDEDLAYVDRLRSAGVPVERVVVPGAFHGFNVVRWAPVVAEFERSMHRAMAAALGVPLRTGRRRAPGGTSPDAG